MKRLLCLLSGFVMLAGCEWDSSSSDQVRTGDVDVNVSGSYRDAGGSFLVQVRGSSGSTQKTATVGTGDGVKTTFAGVLSGSPLVSASVFFTDGGESFTDADGDGVLAGDAGGTGSIVYSSGAFSVNFFLPPGAGKNITVRYATVNAGSGGNSAQGNSGKPIFRFNVVQSGNLVEMTDDIGSSYRGRIEDPFKEFDSGEPRTTLAQGEGRVSQPLLSRAIGLSYPVTLEGMVNGIPVRIEGVFKAEVTIFFAVREIQVGDITSDSRYEELFRRTTFTLVGTWIEVGSGQTANINALGPSDQGARIIPGGELIE